MQKLLVTACCFLFLCNATAQQNKQAQENPGVYFSDAQTYLNDSTNADAAFYCIQKLSVKNYYPLLKELLHNVFTQSFIESKPGDTTTINNQLVGMAVLKKINADTNKLLLETIQPISMWVAAQNNKKDIVALKKLANEFIKTALSSKDIYSNFEGRYGLLIYQLASAHKELKTVAGKLLTIIETNLKQHQVTVTDSSSRAELDKRSWYRYLYAYINHIRAMQTNDSYQKELYLKTAFLYSPDLIDQNHKTAYFYDMLLLFPNQEYPDFKNDYLAFIEKKAGFNKVVILSVLLKISLDDPQYKPRLAAFYTGNIQSSTGFDAYWLDAINARAKTAPPVLLEQTDSKSFSSKQHSGKWVLIDFWGTWCIPCREEHPELQLFYDSTILTHPAQISFLSIACKDTPEKVLAYMAEKHFSFPVAMSDGIIQRTYDVQGYPTKILITPQGKYIVMPYGEGWANFIKQYCNL